MRSLLIAIGITLLLILVAGVIALFRPMKSSMDHVWTQHQLGVAYMEGITPSEIDFILKDAEQLMNSQTDKGGWTNLGPFSDKPVPERWREVGIEGIRCESDRVAYYFCGGGPVERTLLNVVRLPDGSVKVEAWYRTEQHPKLIFQTNGEQ